MNKEFIPYEEALVLKELGFDEECFGVYRHKTKRITIGRYHNIVKNSQNMIQAPIYQQAFSWFREKYKIFGEINLTTKQEGVESFEFFCLDINEPLYESIDYNTYEEAELACLRKLIKIVNQNKDEK